MKLIKHDKLEEAIADTGINNMDMSDVDNDTEVNIEVPFQYADAIKKHKERIKRNSELFKETDKLGDELVKENQRDSHSKTVKTEPLRKMKLSESLFEDWDDEEDDEDWDNEEDFEDVAEYIEDHIDYTSRAKYYDLDPNSRDLRWIAQEDMDMYTAQSIAQHFCEYFEDSSNGKEYVLDASVRGESISYVVHFKSINGNAQVDEGSTEELVKKYKPEVENFVSDTIEDMFDSYNSIEELLKDRDSDMEELIEDIIYNVYETYNGGLPDYDDPGYYIYAKDPENWDDDEVNSFLDDCGLEEIIRKEVAKYSNKNESYKTKKKPALTEKWVLTEPTRPIGNILDDQYEDGAYEDHGLNEEEFMTIYNLYDNNITDEEFVEKVKSISPEYGEWLQQYADESYSDDDEEEWWHDLSEEELKAMGAFDNLNVDESLNESYDKPPLKDNENHEEDGFWAIRKGQGRTVEEELKNTGDHLGVISDFLSRERDEVNINHHIVTVYDEEGEELEEITGQKAFYFLTQGNGQPYTNKEILGYEIEGPELDAYDPDGDGYVISIWVDNTKHLTEASTKPFNIDDVDIFDLVYRAFTFSDDQVTLKDKSGKPMNPKVIQGLYTEDEVSVTPDDNIRVRVKDEKLLDKGIQTAEEYEIEYTKGYDKASDTYTLTLDPWTVDAEKLYNDYNMTDKFTKGAHAQKSYSTAGKRGRKPKKEGLEESIRVSVEEFIPSDEALPTFNLIKESGKIEDLDELTDQMYDKGITAEQLNDLLLYDRDWLLEMLDITEGLGD